LALPFSVKTTKRRAIHYIFSAKQCHICYEISLIIRKARIFIACLSKLLEKDAVSIANATTKNAPLKDNAMISQRF